MLAIKSWCHTTHLDFQGAFASFRGVGGDFYVLFLFFFAINITDFIFLIVFYMHGIIFFLMLQVESLFLLGKDFFFM